MKIKSITLILMMLILSTKVWSQEIDLDYAAFLGDENVGIVETYINVPRSMFEFVEKEGLFESSIFFRVALIQSDSIVAIDEWSVKDKKFSKDDDTKGQKIPEISVLQAKPGKYQLALYVFDLNTEEKHKKTMEIEIPDYNEKDLKISDILLGLQMGKTTTENKFSKYFGFDILPNASSVFSEGHLKIYPFCEIYNLKYEEGQTNTYQIKYTIFGSNGREVKVLKESVKKKPGPTAVEVSLKGLDITDIASGSYVLNIEVGDIQTKQTTEENKRFYVIRQKEGDFLGAEDNIVEDLSKLTEEELDKKFGPLSYIASNMEKTQYKKSDLVGKRTIINNFWKNKDPNPETQINEAYIDFTRRYQRAETAFNQGFRKGWRSDRGRVLIKYGEPSEIERFPSSISNRPYEIWHYNEIEGGVIFVFLDKSGFGDLELVHSTARNELQNPDWQNMLEIAR
jgi:GWxTD domain-containing protein